MTDLQRKALARPPLTEEELAAIAARAEAATPGPWLAWQGEAAGSSQWGGKAQVAGLPRPTVDRSEVFTEADGVFIAHARDDVPRLVADVRHLRAELVEALRWKGVADRFVGLVGECIAKGHRARRVLLDEIKARDGLLLGAGKEAEALRAKLAEAEAEITRLRAQLADAPADY